jgi:hypothetical protein
MQLQTLQPAETLQRRRKHVEVSTFAIALHFSEFKAGDTGRQRSKQH